MHCSTDMNADGSMKVTVTYTVSASVNVKNSAPQEEIDRAFKQASAMCAEKACAEFGTKPKTEKKNDKKDHEKAADKKAAEVLETREEFVKNAIENAKNEQKSARGPLANAGGIWGIL